MSVKSVLMIALGLGSLVCGPAARAATVNTPLFSLHLPAHWLLMNNSMGEVDALAPPPPGSPEGPGLFLRYCVDERALEAEDLPGSVPPCLVVPGCEERVPEALAHAPVGDSLLLSHGTRGPIQSAPQAGGATTYWAFITALPGSGDVGGAVNAVSCGPTGQVHLLVAGPQAAAVRKAFEGIRETLRWHSSLETTASNQNGP